MKVEAVRLLTNYLKVQGVWDEEFPTLNGNIFVRIPEINLQIASNFNCKRNLTFEMDWTLVSAKISSEMMEVREFVFNSEFYVTFFV